VNSDRRTAIILGILLISGILFGILNSVPALENPDYLTKLATIKMQVLIAVFFQSAMATVYVCIAALLYPIIKRYHEGLAIAYFGFRIIGAAFLFVGIASLLLLLTLSQSFVSTGQPNSIHFQTAGELLRTGRDLMCLGGLILYYCIFKMQLVPKWLSIWGFVGSSLTIIATLMLMLGFIKIVTPTYFLMNAPTAFFELSLAVFLLVKGFNPSIVHSNESSGRS
jgi:MFS family permease